MTDKPKEDDATSAEAGDEITLRAVWVGVDDVPVEAANQFVSQFEANGFILSFGMVTPPLLIGSPEERFKQAKKLDLVPIRPLGRFFLSPEWMRQLIDILQENYTKYQKAHGDNK